MALIGCAWLAPSEAFGQSALDLPGMDAVMMHHDLSTTTLDRTWTEHVQAAVLVSQGWVEVATPKAGIPVEDLQVLRGPNVPQALLAMHIQPRETPVAYPTDRNTFVVVSSQGFMEKWSARYLINAQAQLK